MLGTVAVTLMSGETARALFAGGGHVGGLTLSVSVTTGVATEVEAALLRRGSAWVVHWGYAFQFQFQVRNFLGQFLRCLFPFFIFEKEK